MFCDESNFVVSYVIEDDFLCSCFIKFRNCRLYLKVGEFTDYSLEIFFLRDNGIVGKISCQIARKQNLLALGFYKIRKGLASCKVLCGKCSNLNYSVIVESSEIVVRNTVYLTSATFLIVTLEIHFDY